MHLTIKCFRETNNRQKSYGPSSPVRRHVTIHPLLHSCTKVYRVYTVNVLSVRFLSQYIGTTFKTFVGIYSKEEKYLDNFFILSTSITLFKENSSNGKSFDAQAL